MPRQNRVDPFGNIIAHPGYGMLMGNRGCLHDDHGNLVRTAGRDAWITCLPRWPGVRRTLMAPGHYTELFFLDEATAMAAGHRPCGSCRRDALEAFKMAWQRAYGMAQLPRVAEIDAVLRSKNEHKLTASSLPDGAMIGDAGQPLLHWAARWLVWTSNGYAASPGGPAACLALTSAPMCAVLHAGYRPVMHPTADQPISITRHADNASVNARF